MTQSANDRFLKSTAVGGETTMPFDFLIEAKAELEVIRTSVAGVDTVLSLNTHYSIADNQLNLANGGVITLVSPASATAGEKYTCRGITPASRSSDFQTGGDLLAATINTQFDRLTRIAQQNERDLNDAVRLARTSTFSGPIYMEDPEDATVQYYDQSSGMMINGPTIDDIEDAAANATAAAASAAKLSGTSTTSLAIGTGSKAFTTQSGKFFDTGSFLLITSDANPTVNYMFGNVTAYSGTSLTVNVLAIGGSGTLADWTIRVAGARGADGAAGSLDFSALTEDTAPDGTADYTVTRDASAGANKKVLLHTIFSTIDTLTAETAPATGDKLPFYDVSAAAARHITLANMLKVINGLTADSSPDTAADYTVTYDASAGAAKKVLLNLLAGVSGVSIQVFTASGTWTKPAGVKYALFIVQGAGGGGGGADSTGAGAETAAGGGASGGLSISAIDVTGVVSYAIAIGAGGAGGADTGGNGSAGGNSTVNTTTVVAIGGDPGIGTGSAAAAAAISRGGSSAAAGTGNAAFGGSSGNNGSTDAAGGNASGGNGAGGIFGTNGGRGGIISAGASVAAPTVGANGGGGGGGASTATTGQAGGDGGDGYVLVIEFK